MALFLGVLVGAILGLTGAGGSIFAVPLLMAGLGWTLPQAAPVALLAVCAAATFGTVVAWDVTYVRYRAAMLMALAGWFSAPLGLKAAAILPVDLLTGLFAVVLVVVAVRLLVQTRSAPGDAGIVRARLSGDENPSAGRVVRLDGNGRIIWTTSAVLAMGTIGAGTGFLAGLLGVGGGFVIVPALRMVSGLSMHSIIATSLMAIALTSAGTVAAAMMQGHEMPWNAALPFLLGALVGMLLGRQLAPRIAGARLQLGFAGLMLLVGITLGAHALNFI